MVDHEAIGDHLSEPFGARGRPAAETIAAPGTASGRSAIAVVRVSGARVESIARGLLGGLPAPRQAELRDFLDAGGQPLDRGLALYFPGPRSYTGEPMLELHGHGGAVAIDLLLDRCRELGARIARPGEFSERAFLNGKIDLVQAEAVADLIDSASRAAARAAVRSLRGALSTRLAALGDRLIRLRALVEASLDFPEEDEAIRADHGVAGELAALVDALTSLIASCEQGRALRDGLSVTLVGPPNAGKSSLLNRLVGEDRAIVSDLAGTTRDTIEVRALAGGIALHLVDTAGLRESPSPVEREGVRRARAAMRDADVVVLVVDDDRTGDAEVARLLAEAGPAERSVVVYNKCDLSRRAPGRGDRDDGVDAFTLSARTGAGVAAFVDGLKRRAGLEGGVEVEFMARRRHIEAMEASARHLRAAAATPAPELLAEELRLSMDALGAVTGRVSSDELLGEIFARFCIGK